MDSRINFFLSAALPPKISLFWGTLTVITHYGTLEVLPTVVGITNLIFHFLCSSLSSMNMTTSSLLFRHIFSDLSVIYISRPLRYLLSSQRLSWHSYDSFRSFILLAIPSSSKHLFHFASLSFCKLTAGLGSPNFSSSSTLALSLLHFPFLRPSCYLTLFATSGRNYHFSHPLLSVYNRFSVIYARISFGK